MAKPSKTAARSFGPVDVHDRAVTSGIAPAAHVEAVERKLAAVPLAVEQQVAVSPKLAAANPMSCASLRSIWRSARRWPKRAGRAFVAS